MTDLTFPTEHPTLATLRRVLLFILVIGLVGTVVEMLLLRHTEGFWQILPIVLLAAALPVLVWCSVSPGPTSLRALQALMTVFLLSGIVGVILHYQGNAVYEMESMPGVAGSELFRKAVMGTTPTLAPGTMIQLGLVGFAYTFRHPRLRSKSIETRSAPPPVGTHPY